MALLNFALTYNEVKGFLDPTSTPEATSGDYVKLFFSKDGHIITHGKDFLASPDNDAKKILRGNTTWAAITTSDLPIAANTSTFNANTIFTTLQIQQYVSQLFSANDAMRYKGTITKTADGYTHNTTGTEVAGFPASCEVGDTYRVTTDNDIYAGYTCSVGDLLICIKDGPKSGDTTINAKEYWTAVESNINAEVTHMVNNSPIKTYSSSTNTFTIYAPTDGGTENQILISKGSTSTPIWTNLGNITAGAANKVLNALSAGAGLSLGATDVKFDGSVARTITLLPATHTTIGGVIIDSENTNKTITVDSNGNIRITAENIKNALGYVPGNAADINWRPILIGGTSIGEKQLNFVPSGDVYLKADSNGDDILDISFGLSWYNISTSGYETA